MPHAGLHLIVSAAALLAVAAVARAETIKVGATGHCRCQSEIKSASCFAGYTFSNDNVEVAILVSRAECHLSLAGLKKTGWLSLEDVYAEKRETEAVRIHSSSAEPTA